MLQSTDSTKTRAAAHGAVVSIIAFRFPGQVFLVWQLEGGGVHNTLRFEQGEGTFLALLNPFTLKSDQFQITPEILHHIV